MQGTLSRRSFVAVGALLAAGSVLGLGACGGGAAQGSTVRIGTMPTEDILPMWVAERDALFERAGVDAQVVVFDSAQNLSAAIAAGEVDLAMTDPMRAVKLCESGTDVRMEWITLGSEAAQGRFGVLAGANSGVSSLRDLVAGAASGSSSGARQVGVAANTVPEYVLDRLCEQAGLDPEKLDKVEVASLPERYSLVASGKLAAAALPGSMLALGQAQGMHVVADDSTGDNLSQSVMVVRSAYLDGNGGSGRVEAVAAAWDLAAQAVNGDPQAYRSLLVDKANLNDAVAGSYPVPTYPLATAAGGGLAFPPAKLIDPQLAWMKARGYTDKDVRYDEADGSIDIS